VSAQDEDELVTSLRRGDEQAFRALVERHYPMMKRVARGFVDSEAVAEEVVQDTWLAVVDGIDRFERRSALTTWLFSILLNQAKTRSAREARSRPFSAVGPPDADDAVPADRFQKDDDAQPGQWASPPRAWQHPERRLLSLEVRGHLKAALDELPERQRLVVALRDVEGLEADDVCELLELSPENQRVLLHRGRTRLRQALESYVMERSEV
jgi:RNA polymerase sigma-70 factor, ECF subfamily